MLTCEDRKKLCQNILLTGGTTMLAGFFRRFCEEINIVIESEEFKDLENLKYSILVSIDYGQSFKIFNLYNDNEKEIYKLFLIDSDENIDYFETNFNGDVLLIRGKNIFDKYLNILNNKISLEFNSHYDLKFINKKANRNLVPLSKEPFFVYYSDNKAFDLNLFNKLEEYIKSSYSNNNHIQSILSDLIVISEDLYKNPSNDKFISLSKYLKDILNTLMQIADNSYLENILYILLDEREPVIRDYNSLLEQIQEFKKRNVENFQLITRVIIDMKNLNLKNFYKDIVKTILSLRTNNLFLKDLIIQVNIEIFLKLNISSIIYDLYKIFEENVKIFNSNMQELDRRLQNYFLLTEYYSKEEIEDHIRENSQHTTNIIKNIEFITRKSGGNIPIIINFGSGQTFFQNINKVKSVITRNLNFNTKVFIGTAYQNLFKNVFSIPNKYMKNLPVISSRDFMYTSPLFWQVGDIDFPQTLSDLLVYDNSTYPPEWNKLKDTDLKWKGYGNSNLEDYCINNKFKKIYDFSGGDKIPDWELKIDDADYWIEERDANGIYEEILSKWNLIESSIIQQERSCVATGILDDLSITKSQPQKLKDIMIDWGFNVDTEVRENTRSQIIAKYVDTYSNGENAITKDGLYFYNFALNSSIYKSQPSGSFNSSFFTRIDWNFKVLNPDYRLNEIYKLHQVFLDEYKFNSDIKLRKKLFKKIIKANYNWTTNDEYDYIYSLIKNEEYNQVLSIKKVSVEKKYKQKLIKLFCEMDINGDNTIDALEFNSFMKNKININTELIFNKNNLTIDEFIIQILKNEIILDNLDNIINQKLNDKQVDDININNCIIFLSKYLLDIIINIYEKYYDTNWVYINEELLQINKSKYGNFNYPIGLIGTSEIHFLHEKDFAEAKSKGDRRKKRLDEFTKCISTFLKKD